MFFPGQFHYVLASLFAVFCGCYYASAAFRFRVLLWLYYLYFIVAATFLLPFMMVNGRSRKNIALCQISQRLSGKLFGLRSTVINKENLVTDGPSVIVSNHQSALDVTGMGKLLSERSTILAKRQLLYTGPFGLGIWLSGFVFVDRSKTRESREVLAKVAAEVNKEGLCVWVFAEGTRNISGEMLPFKRGAFNLAVEAQAPIVPVVFSSYKKFYNPEEHVFTSGNYTIEVLPPISTKNLTPGDVPRLADETRLKMMKAFGRISAEDANN